MGTRGLTCVIMDGEHRIAQYGQWDHYPSGQGVTALEFCRENLTSKRGIKKFKAAVGKTYFISDEERSALWAEFGVDIEASGGMVSCDIANEFGEKHPSLTRDAGAEILSLVLNGETRLNNSLDFIEDSLFCEYAYIVNLDTGMLEVYEGFQHAKHNKGRYADRVPQDKACGDTYYPCALVAEFPLDNLPTKEEFLEQLEKEEKSYRDVAVERVNTMAGADVNVPRILADLRHYCEAVGINFASEARKATKLHKQEQGFDSI